MMDAGYLDEVRGLLARGVYWPPSQFEAAFLGATHSASDIANTVEAASAALGGS